MAASACNDITDAVELFEPQGLYLKPIAKLNICVQLPQLKQPGKSISNWEVMEKIKSMIKPEQFISLKIIKSTLEFLRFEGEIESKALLKNVIAKLDSKIIKLSGFPDALKVRAAEAKVQFPTRHDWDSYFRDAKNMNEIKPGERPDTIHIREVPSRWFSNRKDKEKDRPSEYILKKVYETFGDIRCVDIPMLDPYRKEQSNNSGHIQTFSYGQDLAFEAYIQFKEYIGFVKAMDALRGMKLLYVGEDGKAATANIKVDFDKTKHLSDKAIRKRRLEREKLKLLEQEREEKVRKEREEEERRKEEERRRKEEEERERERKREEKLKRREDRRKEREEHRRMKRIEKQREEEEKKIALKIAVEERKILLAQRRLDSIRLLTEVIEKVKTCHQSQHHEVKKQQEELEKREKELEEESTRIADEEKKKSLEKERKKLVLEKRKKDKLEKQERELRDRILQKISTIEEKKAEVQREELRKKLSGSVKLKSAIVMKK